MLETGLVVSRFLHFTATLVLFGWCLFPLVVDRAKPAPRRALIALAGLALVGGAGWFVFTAGSMAGALSDALTPATLWAVLTQTDFGPLWLARLGLLAAIVIWIGFRPPTGRCARVLTGASGIVLVSLAGTGHARIGGGVAAAAHMVADALHLVAAGAWLGALAGLLAMWSGAADARAAAVHGFSRLGYAAVATLLASGLVNGWMVLSGPEALISTPYGRLLDLKVALFLVMLTLAAANRLWLTPKMGLPEAPRLALSLHRNVFAELALGIGVVAIVSGLGTLATVAG
jgi:copper resistance protein D